jgi:hypothetical protein
MRSCRVNGSSHLPLGLSGRAPVRKQHGASQSPAIALTSYDANGCPQATRRSASRLVEAGIQWTGRGETDAHPELVVCAFSARLQT